ncbi:50S ribosomal protein L29 [Roseivirga sp. BDSF3-8]|uniref:50S ribosomal protein L29 n=1 Tax=Roseivirga sp. BDSF3-8 TaxID=3241598 RepID=UPI00353190EE
MKYSEIQSLSSEELNEKIASEQEALRKLKFAHAISPIENPMKIKESRRNIAKLQTALRSKSGN